MKTIKKGLSSTSKKEVKKKSKSENSETAIANPVKKPVKDKVIAENKKVIEDELAVKKFKGIDYEGLDTKKQKRFRAQIRSRLFRLILQRTQAKLGKALTPEFEKSNFEEFKKFVAENYTHDNVAIIFKGTGDKQKDFDTYIMEYKAYLATRPTTKKKH